MSTSSRLWKSTLGRWSDLLGGRRRSKGIRSPKSYQLRLEPLEQRQMLTIYAVDSLSDVVASDSVITLREALEAANTNAAVHDAPAGSSTETDVIQFSSSLFSGGAATITLGGTQLSITDDTEIQGPGAELLTIDANELSRVFYVGFFAEVTLSGMTITGGSATYGGGVYALEGTLMIVDSAITGNEASGGGGGISAESSDVGVVNSTISHNVANGTDSADGGGISISDSDIAIIGSAILNNSAASGEMEAVGGGVNAYDCNITIIDSILSGNTATSDADTSRGGGISGTACALTIVNTVFSGNTAMGNSSDGGGVSVSSSTATIINSTIAGNESTGSGGGIYNSSSTVTAHNCIVSLNEAVNSPDLFGSLAAGSGNNLIATDPRFIRDPFDGGDGWGDNPSTPAVDESANDDYGDLRLSVLSPAINAGDNAQVIGSTDLGGDPRIIGGAVDMGAYEFQQIRFVVTSTDDDQDAYDGVVTLREAIQAANSNTGTAELPAGSNDTADVIIFDDALFTGGAATITLGGSYLSITDDAGIEIQGPGDDLLTITGNGASRVFALGAGAVADISGLTITGGSATYGGGIYLNSGAELTLSECAITGNIATMYGGGGIESHGGSLTVIDSLIAGNTATGNHGGGILSGYSGSAVTIVNSIISNNTAGIYGGGICLNLGKLDVTNGSIISDNTATSSGGGIYGNTGTEINISSSTISDNESGYCGGGVYGYTDSVITIDSSTLSGNTAAASGGGMVGYNNEVHVDGSTFHDNEATNHGGAIYIGSGAALDVADSVFTDNTAVNYYGGAIAGFSGVVAIEDSTLSGNSAYLGGGIYLYDATVPATPHAITGTTITYNTAVTSSGGGIYNNHSAVAITGSNILGNESLAGHGGGIYAYGSGATTVVTGSTISGNTAALYGGGVHSDTGTSATIQTSTIADNEAGYGGGVYGYAATIVVGESIVSGNTATTSGGGIRAYAGSVTVTDSDILDNNGGDYGGGICGWNSTAVISVTGSTISGNTAQNGAGIYGYQIAVSDSTVSENVGTWGGGIRINLSGGLGTLTVENSTITGNTASGGGGILIAPGATAIVTDSTISDNTATSAGGGAVSVDSGCTLTISGSTLSGNTAGTYGGGVHGSGALQISISNSKLLDNSANYGGGVFGYNSGFAILDSIISGNSASANGGGIRLNACGNVDVVNSMLVDNEAGTLGGGIYCQASTLNVTNSTLVANRAISSSGGGLYSDGASLTTVRNSILALNEATAYPGYRDFYGSLQSGSDYNLVGHWDDTSPFGPNSILGTTADPLTAAELAFTVVSDEDDHVLYYRPQATNLAIDAGSNALALAPDDDPLAEDMLGRARIIDGTVDIGALEFASPKLVPSVAATVNEGSVYTVTIQVLVPEDDAVTTWEIDWGDGTTTSGDSTTSWGADIMDNGD
ncbi:MAG: right-handed parallel beta-helix repeat-containing protein, partial [Pirellulales bacterium]|nr:right-handed parallel beta-helix repeat-containing protein [Pirellulales bacterium]